MNKSKEWNFVKYFKTNPHSHAIRFLTPKKIIKCYERHTNFLEIILKIFEYTL